MGVTNRKEMVFPVAEPVQTPASFGLFLVRTGLLRSNDLVQSLVAQSDTCATIDQIIVSRGLISRSKINSALAEFFHIHHVSLEKDPPDPALSSVLDPKFMLKYNILPWKTENGVILIATDNPFEFDQVERLLPETLRPARPAIASREAIQTYVANRAKTTLTKQASCRVKESESCRSWGGMTPSKLVIIAVFTLALLALTISAPTQVFTALIFWAAFTLVVAACLKTAAFFAHTTNPATDNSVTLPKTSALPKVSVLVPLFRETEIANALVARLSCLTYPKALLDVVLVLEENDTMTRETLAAITLPHWMRVVKVPEGTPKTKPRAMNYALDFCDGDIIGIWDAEDAPEADQITKVAHHFMHAPKEVACVQGILDYYNPRQNWLARCFTIEYATWFRLMLPGMSRLGFAIPLGGTTLFFRRDALEELGGWDAHNVTEDADLGFRLARHGYRTEMIETVTGEEANCHALPWIRQRSRWLKGYMVTYLVHMRSPKTLYRQLGPLKFWSFQAHFITALSQFFLAPFLWSFWLIFFGLPHPLNGVIAHSSLLTFGALFLTAELVNISVSLTAVSGPKHRHLMKWVPSLHFYYPLGVFAAYKALIELVFTPFYWDKTNHGHSLATPATPKKPVPAPAGLPLIASHGIKLESGHESHRNMAL